ncbi:anti-sigma factor [Kitasatospora sp. NPDC056138]|uniref:anti-sigma factor n=1 Tax=Kitasatospora sp. NPDC056138 TaxID=3345724 RepID=UPI0035E08FDF
MSAIRPTGRSHACLERPVAHAAHRRAVDRVRAARAAADRDQRAAAQAHSPVFDEVAEQVEGRPARRPAGQARRPAHRARRPTTTGTATAGPGVGTVVRSHSRGQAGVLAAGMPDLPQGRTYELWFNDAGTMRPAGLLPTGDGSLLLTGAIDGAPGIGVTVEPAGGSQRPSGQPVMLLPFVRQRPPGPARGRTRAGRRAGRRLRGAAVGPTGRAFVLGPVLTTARSASGSGKLRSVGAVRRCGPSVWSVGAVRRCGRLVGSVGAVSRRDGRRCRGDRRRR